MARKSRKSNALPAESRSTASFKAAAYGRLSCENDWNRENGTIDNQIALIKGYIDETIDIELYDVYADKSFSGTNFERPEFERMIVDIKEGKVNCVIVKDLSRLGRNYVEMGNYIERVFPFLNVRFIAITDSFDSFEDNVDLSVPFKNVVNEWYAKDISDKVKSAVHTRWAQGKSCCSICPYGYMKEPVDKHLVIDEEVSDNVKRIYELFVNGMTYSEIARTFNDESIMPPGEYRKSKGIFNQYRTTSKWNMVQIKAILTNQQYVGDYIHGKVICTNRRTVAKKDKSEWMIVKDAHEAIISRTMFENVQKKIEKKYSDIKSYYHQGSKAMHNKNMFFKKIRCKDCGKSMVIDRDWSKSLVYDCVTHRNIDSKACPTHRISIDKVERTVFGIINAHMKNTLNNVNVINELNSKKVNMERFSLYSKEIEKTRKELNSLSYKRQTLYADYAERLLSEQEYLVMTERYDEKNKHLEQRINELTDMQVIYSKKYHLDEDWERTIRQYIGKRKLTKEMVDAFVSLIIIDKSRNIEVRLIYDDLYNELEKIKNYKTSEEVKSNG